MDSVLLPVVKPNVYLGDALAKMHKNHVSSVVVNENGYIWLCKAGDIHTSGLTRDAHVYQLPVKRPVLFDLGLDEDKTLLEQDLNLPETMRSWDKALRRSGLAFGVADFTAQSAQIVTMSEQFTAEINSSPRDCYCQGVRQHGHPSNTCGDKCPYEGATIVCI